MGSGVVLQVVTLMVIIFVTVACGWLASRKGRDWALWGILGFFFNIVPLVVLLVIPKREKE